MQMNIKGGILQRRDFTYMLFGIFILLIVIPAKIIAGILAGFRLRRFARRFFSEIYLSHLREQVTKVDQKDEAEPEIGDEVTKLIQLLEEAPLFGRGVEWRAKYWSPSFKRKFAKTGKILGWSIFGFILVRLILIVLSGVIVAFF